MLVKDVIEIAALKVEEIYDDPTWMRFINLALDDLTPVAKILRTWEMAAPVAVVDGKVEIPFAGNAETLSQAHEVLNVYFKVTNPGAPANDYMQLRRLPQNDHHSQGWKMVTGHITLQGLVKHPLDITVNIVEIRVKIEYYEKLQHVTAVVQDIYTVTSLTSQYHQLLVLFCCAKARQKEEELETKSDFYTEYLVAKRNMALDRTWEMEPQYRKRIRNARLQQQIGGGQ